MRRILIALAFLFLTGTAQAQFVQTIAGTVSPPTFTATDRVGYQTWNKVRLNFDALNTLIKTGTGSPEAVVTATVGAYYRQTDGTNGTTFWLKVSGSGNTGWVAIPSLTSTGTFTGKTYNAESTGNVLTLPFTLDVQAAACGDGAAWSNWDVNPGSPDGPTYECVTGTSNGPIAALDYSDGATQYAFNKFFLPSDWTGAVDLRLMWYTSATTGNVVWQVQTACVADNESVDPSWNTAQTITDAAKGTTERMNVATLSGVTMTGCAAGELFKYRIIRDPAHASDTIATNAFLLEVEWTYRRAI